MFSRQAVQMDALISAFVDEIKQVSFYQAETVPILIQSKWHQQLISEGGHVCWGRRWKYLQRQLFHRGRWWDIASWTIIRTQIFPPIPDCLVPLTTVSRRGIPESCLSNKLSRFVIHHLLLLLVHPDATQADAGHLWRRGPLHRPHGLLELLLLNILPISKPNPTFV